MRPVNRIPLDKLWNERGDINARRKRWLTKSGLRELLRKCRVEFYVADIGHPLRRVDVSKCYDFWKSEAEVHVVEDPDSDYQIEDFPGEYAYLASEWSGERTDSHRAAGKAPLSHRVRLNPRGRTSPRSAANSSIIWCRNLGSVPVPTSHSFPLYKRSRVGRGLAHFSALTVCRQDRTFSDKHEPSSRSPHRPVNAYRERFGPVVAFGL